MQEIAKAFVAAQRAFGPALKSSTNPHFRSRYADLAACVEAVIDALNENGIALIQNCYECQDGVIVETSFLHESGQMMNCGKLHVPATKHDAQGYGSALTYARRYSLMAACGIAPEDDDGNAATKAAPPKPVAKPAPKPEPVKEEPSILQGNSGGWQLAVDETQENWADAVKAATDVLLQLVSSANDVNEIFRRNRIIYDKLKETKKEAYNEIMTIFKTTKEKWSA